MTSLDPSPGDAGSVAIPPDGSPPHATPGASAYEQMQASEEFQGLRRTLRGFAFPATVAFLAWYLLYVLMSGFARGFLDTKVLGNINIAYLFGLLQFLSTFVIAYLYSTYADKHLDPVSDRLRARFEGGER